MVQALPPNRTNDALDVGPLPGGSPAAQHFLDAHVSHLSPEGIAEDSIAVAQQVARGLVEGERFSQLLSRPLRGGVGGHIAVPDVDAQLEQLPVNAGCTPTGILPAHPADQISNLARNDGSSRLAMPDLPGPEKAEASTMPGKDRLGLNDGQRRAPAAPHPGQPDPEEAVPGSQPGTFSRGTLPHADLVP